MYKLNTRRIFRMGSAPAAISILLLGSAGCRNDVTENHDKEQVSWQLPNLLSRSHDVVVSEGTRIRVAVDIENLVVEA